MPGALDDKWDLTLWSKLQWANLRSDTRAICKQCTPQVVQQTIATMGEHAGNDGKDRRTELVTYWQRADALAQAGTDASAVTTTASLGQWEATLDPYTYETKRGTTVSMGPTGCDDSGLPVQNKVQNYNTQHLKPERGVVVKVVIEQVCHDEIEVTEVIDQVIDEEMDQITGSFRQAACVVCGLYIKMPSSLDDKRNLTLWSKSQWANLRSGTRAVCKQCTPHVIHELQCGRCGL
jgi:hypothetical protein